MEENTTTVEETVTDVSEEEVVPQEAPINYDEKFMELAANGDFEAFAKLERDLATNKKPEVKQEPVVQEPVVNTTPEEEGTAPIIKDQVADKSEGKVEQPSQLEILRQQLADRDRMLEEARRANTQPVAPTTQPSVESISIPEVPVRPEGVSFDPADWGTEDVAKMSKYTQEMEQYNTAQNAAVRSLLSGDNSYVGRVEQIEQQLNAERQKVQRDRDEMNFWDGVRKFQNASKEFSTSKDISEIHKDLDTIGEALAKAAGYYPNYSSQDAMNQFEANKGTILAAWLNDDPQYKQLGDSLGLTKPDDVDKYMRIKEIMDYKATAVGAGRLGTTAPLQTAYLDMLNSTGELGKLMESMVIDERSKAYKDKAEAIKDAQSTVRTPSNQGAGGAAQVASIAGSGVLVDTLTRQGLSTDDINFFIKVNSNPTLLQDPSNLERFGAIDGKITI